MENNVYNDADWDEFELTGSIVSYLKYKGVIKDEVSINMTAVDLCENTTAESVGDGEPVGCC